jgi:hypothetical protein
MGNELQNKLDQLLEQKQSYLRPENLKKGVTCMGVVGDFTVATDKTYAELFEIANQVLPTNIENDSEGIIFTLDDELECLVTASKILKGAM